MGQTLIAMDADALSTIAGIISAFGVSMLVFRIQRELHMQELNERNWIPLSDWLLVSATIISLLFVLIPLLLAPRTPLCTRIEVDACAIACVFLAGYVVGILAHYRLIFRGNRSGPRDNPEPSELIVVLVTIIAAVGLILAFG